MAISASSTASCSLLLSSASFFRIPSGEIITLGYWARSIVDGYRTCHFWLLVASSFVVFLGIAFEWWEIKHECTKAWKTFRRIDFKDSPIPPLATIFGAIGWLLILVGVFGECWFEVKVNLDDNDIAAINNVILEKTGELAKEASDSANKADLFAWEAQTKADAVDQKADETASRLQAANEAADAEQAKRAELEKSIAPRELWFKIYQDGTTNVDDLKAFGLVQVRIKYVQDAEALRTAANLAFLFDKAGWKVSATPATELLPDGITVRSYDPTLPQGQDLSAMQPTINAIRRSVDICVTVQDWLMLNKWAEVSSFGDFSKTLGPNEIWVEVGFKPNPYFASPPIKQITKKAIQEFMTNPDLRRRAPNANPNKPTRSCELRIGPRDLGSPTCPQ